MTRIHLILLIAASLFGMRGMDSLWSSSKSHALAMGSDQCVMTECHEEIREVLCCDTKSVHNFCKMSNGPCTCGIKPIDDRSPNEIIITELPTRLISIARKGSIRAGFSHNQTQALLGVWQR